MFFLGRFHFNYPCTQVENPARMEGMEGYKSDHDLITCKGKVFNPAVHIQWDTSCEANEKILQRDWIGRNCIKHTVQYRNTSNILIQSKFLAYLFDLHVTLNHLFVYFAKTNSRTRKSIPTII